MSGFTALNVEPDENPQEDVDNTREIQIEEALKLYQNALKLHAQGPKFYEQASAAYSELFESDIFEYPEALTEFDRLERNPEAEFDPELALGLELEIQAAAVSELSSSLTQILFLSFKNRGQFIIDLVRFQTKNGAVIPDEELRQSYTTALSLFIKALARDESDTELWRRAAKLGMLVGSSRIARYCLEAAVEVDDDPTQEEVEPTALDEGFAGVLLKDLLVALEDRVALSHPILAPYQKKKISDKLKKFLDPYPFLPELSLGSTQPPKSQARYSTRSKISIRVSERSWKALVEAVLRQWLEDPGSSTAVTLDVPGVALEGDIPMADSTTQPDTLPFRQHASSKPVIRTVETASNDDCPAVEDIVQSSTETAVDPESGLAEEASHSSRKRSQSVAGLRDTPDDETAQQKRSKRIRNRETFGAEGIPTDPAALLQEQLAAFDSADADMFNYVNNILDRFHIPSLGSFASFQNAFESDRPLAPEEKLSHTMMKDLKEALMQWNEIKAASYVSGNTVDFFAPADNASTKVAAFLEHVQTGSIGPSSPPSPPSTAGIDRFVRIVNNGWMTLQDVAFELFNAISRTYEQSTWSGPLKDSLMQLMSHSDEALYTRIRDIATNSDETPLSREYIHSIEKLGQMIFELHLDMYVMITNPSSRVLNNTRKIERERLVRWAALSIDLFLDRPDVDDEFMLRYLWSQCLYVSIKEDSQRDYIIECWTDMKRMLERYDNPTILTANNTAMPEISAGAAEREISKLTTADFFTKLLSSNDSDPVLVIQTLEPVLYLQSTDNDATLAPEDCQEGREVAADAASSSSSSSSSEISPALRSMWKFLESGNANLQLYLWQRLREAYTKIKYSTRVFSCHLKSIEVIVANLTSVAFVDSSPEARQNNILSWLKTVDDFLIKALHLALNDAKAFEIIDDAHVKSSMSALVHLCRCLHSVSLIEDRVKVGATRLPSGGLHLASGPWGSLLIRLRDMQVRCWALLYTLIKDGMSQNKDEFPVPDNDLADYLAIVHYNMGLRKTCKWSNRIFLKMMKLEMLRFKHVERWDDYLGQVLYDLYGLKLGVGIYELAEHDCPHDPLDRRTALAIVDKIVKIANGMPIKDLLKHDIRVTIEKMQQVIGTVKTAPSMQHNLRNINDYGKSALNPIDLYRALRGQLQLDSVPVTTPDRALADTGWFFLHGMIALTRFKSQKRLAPGATDDLRVAVTFFRLQLQFQPDHWEAWYRLAQVHDADLEENVLFSADKLNSNTERKLIVGYQRNAIHCYAMGVSYAIRNAEATFETAGKLSELYHDFGMRVYATSREPFHMEPFYMDDFKRFLSLQVEAPTVTGLHPEMQTSKAIKYAVQLFINAAKGKPNFWLNYHMLGKCYWKLYCRIHKGAAIDPEAKQTDINRLLLTLERAIELCPRPSRTDPILEPHYKYMSIMHKLVKRGHIDPQTAADKMQQQPYAIQKGERVHIKTGDDWTKFILASLKHIRHADKSNWQHRIVFRIAMITCDEERDPAATLKELKVSLFSKTMVFNVWKPEYERPGRHAVYVAKYVTYMLDLLLYLNDKFNFEQLIKRVRKRPADIIEFNKVWAMCVEKYLVFIRRERNTHQFVYTPDGLVKGWSGDGERFIKNTENIKTAIDNHGERSPRAMQTFNLMKELEDLKKLNGNAVKSHDIDECLMELYCDIWDEIDDLVPPVVVPGSTSAPEPAPEPPVPQRSQGPMSITSMLDDVENAQAPSPPPVSQLPQASQSAVSVEKPRTRGPTKKDLLRIAEALLVKPEPAKPAAATAQRPALGTNNKSTTDSINSGSGKEREESVNDGDGDDERRRDSNDEGDDADDESDLSDLEMEDAGETGDTGIVFPNLGASNPDSWKPANAEHVENTEIVEDAMEL